MFAVFLYFFLDILFWSLSETEYWAKQNRLQIHLATVAVLIFSLHEEENKFKEDDAKKLPPSSNFKMNF